MDATVDKSTFEKLIQECNSLENQLQNVKNEHKMMQHKFKMLQQNLNTKKQQIEILDEQSVNYAAAIDKDNLNNNELYMKTSNLNIKIAYCENLRGQLTKNSKIDELDADIIHLEKENETLMEELTKVTEEKEKLLNEFVEEEKRLEEMLLKRKDNSI